MFERGLMEPYGYSVTSKFAARVNQRIKATDAKVFAHAEGIDEHLEQLVKDGEEEVEVFGIWQWECISDVTQKILDAGMKVRIPKDFIVPVYPSSFDFKTFIRLLTNVNVKPTEDSEFYYFSPVKGSDIRYVDISGRDLDSLSVVSQRYRKQVNSGEISPCVIKTSKEDWKFPITEEQRAVLALEREKIWGVAIYEVVCANVIDPDAILNERYGDLGLFVDRRLTAPVNFSGCAGFKDYSGQNEMVELEGIESFGKGIGRGLVEHIRETRSVETMVAWLLNPDKVRGFYEKLDFIDSGVCLYEADTPLMVWNA